eukprot:5768609-Amphidinium_carterae.1
MPTSTRGKSKEHQLTAVLGGCGSTPSSAAVLGACCFSTFVSQTDSDWIGCSAKTDAPMHDSIACRIAMDKKGAATARQFQQRPRLRQGCKPHPSGRLE